MSVPKQVYCKSVVCDPSVKLAHGNECSDGSSAQNIVLVPKSPKFVDDLVKQKRQNAQKSAQKRQQQEADLRRQKCGLYGLRKTPSQKVVPCPKGMTEYKYYYDDRCRSIKDTTSTNILTKARHLPMLICIPNNLTVQLTAQGIVLTTPKEQSKLEDAWKKRRP